MGSNRSHRHAPEQVRRAAHPGTARILLGVIANAGAGMVADGGELRRGRARFQFVLERRFGRLPRLLLGPRVAHGHGHDALHGSALVNCCPHCSASTQLHCQRWQR